MVVQEETETATLVLEVDHEVVLVVGAEGQGEVVGGGEILGAIAAVVAPVSLNQTLPTSNLCQVVDVWELVTVQEIIP